MTTIEQTAAAIEAEAQRLGVEIARQHSRLSDSVYLSIQMPAGTKCLDFSGRAEIRISDHGTTTGTGLTLLSVRTDLPHHDKLQALAMALLRYAAGERGADAISPCDVRQRLSRTIQIKGGKRIPNPLFVGAA